MTWRRRVLSAGVAAALGGAASERGHATPPGPAPAFERLADGVALALGERRLEVRGPRTEAAQVVKRISQRNLPAPICAR